MIIPIENYEEAKFNRVKQEMESMMDAMFPAMVNKMIPAVKEAIQKEMLDEKGDFSAVIGIRMQKVLEEEGLEIKQIKDKDKKS